MKHKDTVMRILSSFFYLIFCGTSCKSLHEPVISRHKEMLIGHHKTRPLFPRIQTLGFDLCYRLIIIVTKLRSKWARIMMSILYMVFAHHNYALCQGHVNWSWALANDYVDFSSSMSWWRHIYAVSRMALGLGNKSQQLFSSVEITVSMTERMSPWTRVNSPWTYGNCIGWYVIPNTTKYIATLPEKIVPLDFNFAIITNGKVTKYKFGKWFYLPMMLLLKLFLKLPSSIMYNSSNWCIWLWGVHICWYEYDLQSVYQCSL